MQKFNRFVPISKVDEEEQMVYGFASTPALDSQGEVVEVSALEKALPEYLKFPTIREMHQAKAIGITKETKIESGKGLFIGAKIVDKDAWLKVKEGVYRAFSIGGAVRQKVDNTIKDLMLTEISLVDRPANPEAVITVFKSEQSPTKQFPIPKLLQKYMDEMAVDTAEYNTILTTQISDSMDVLSVACQLIWLYITYSYEAKDTSLIESTLRNLKQLAMQILSDDDTKKFNDLMDIAKFDNSINVLEKAFKNTMSNYSLTKGVTMAQEMEKAKKDEKVEAAAEAPKTEVTEVTETKSSDEQKPETVEAQVEQPVAPPNTVVDEAKQASAMPSTLEKLQSLEKSLETPVEKKDMASVEKLDSLEKTVDVLTSVVEKLVDRIKVLEAEPAAPKTVASFVTQKSEGVSAPSSEVSKRKAEIKARLDELSLIREKNLEKFQQDHAMEAKQLISELSRLG